MDLGQNGRIFTYYVRVDSCHTNLAWRKYNANPSFYGSGFVRTNGTHGTPSSWSDFVNNYGGTGVNADPKFSGNWRLGQYGLKSNSPAINAGTNMLYYLNKYVGYLPGFDPMKDLAGNPRNDGRWDIGAYQHTGNDTTFSLLLNITDGNNLVSVPGINPAGMGVSDWWTNLTGSVFKLVPGSGYIEVTTTTPSVGYWIKHTGTTTYYYPQIQIVPHDPIAGASGWNLIGGYELSVSAAM